MFTCRVTQLITVFAGEAGLLAAQLQMRKLCRQSGSCGNAPQASLPGHVYSYCRSYQKMSRALALEQAGTLTLPGDRSSRSLCNMPLEGLVDSRTAAKAEHAHRHVPLVMNQEGPSLPSTLNGNSVLHCTWHYSMQVVR